MIITRDKKIRKPKISTMTLKETLVLYMRYNITFLVTRFYAEYAIWYLKHSKSKAEENHITN